MLERAMTRRLILVGLVVPWCFLAAQEAETSPGGETEPVTKYAVSGVVTDPQGVPLEGAEIWLRVKGHDPTRKAGLGDEWTEPISVRSDESGKFTVAPEVEGPYRLFLIHPDHPPRPYGETVEDGASIEFSFPEPIAFSGYVLDENGEALAGADVTACANDAPKFGAYACLQTRTDADGKYTFKRLAEGTYAFQAWAPGHTLSALQPGRFRLADDAGKTPGPLTLERGAEVSGTVRDDAGTPLPGVRVSYVSDRVRLRQVRGQRDVAPVNPILTDAEGNFEFHGLPAGEALKMFADVAKRGRAESKTLTLEAGAVLGGVAVVYQRPASATVHLIDRDEQPIESVEVLWRPAKDDSKPSGSGFRLAGSKGQTEVESNGEGHFTIRGIKPDRYDVTLLPAGHREIEIGGVRVRAGAEVDLGTHVARPGATLSGHVIDDLGRPVEGAKLEGLYLRDSVAMSRSVKSAADGRFALGGLTEAPLLWLTVEAEGYARKREQRVDPAQIDYEIVLERVGAVNGRVLLESGDRAKGVEAHLEPAAGTLAVRRAAEASAKGDEEGRFEIEDAAPGTYTLRLTAKSARPLRVKDVVVEAGAPTDVGTHMLEQGRELSGSVLDARDGSPIVGAAVKVDAASGGLIGGNQDTSTSMTDDDGRFVVGGLGLGRFSVQVEHADYAAAKTEATLKEGQPFDELTIRLGQGGTLRGTVRDESGRGAADRSLSLAEGGGFLAPSDRIVRTNDVGEYRVERVRPGSYHVTLYPDSAGSPMDIRRKTATIVDGEETVVDFDSETKIRFEGLLTRGGRPVGEVNVILIPTDSANIMQAKSASVDLSGRFELGLDRPGTYNVMVQDLKTSLGAPIGQTRIVVPDEPSVSLEIVLQSGTIAGSVLSASGEPIEGSFVSAVREGANMNEIGSSTGAMADPDGSYRIEGVNEGTYTLSAIADGYQVAARTVTVGGAETLDAIDFRLETAGQINGRVVDIHGNGIRGAYVFAFPSGTAGASTGIPTETDAEGFFRVSAPSDGPCDIEAVAKGLAPGVVSAVVPQPESEGPGPVVTLTPGGTILVRVVDAGGEPVDGIQVGIQPERSSQALMIAMMFSPTPPTDASGTTRASHLPGGSYQVSISGRPGVVPRTVTVTGDGETAVTLQLP